MHGRLHHPTDTQRQDRPRWWGITWRLAAVLALGVTLASPSPGQAKTFHCGAGDVQCLIDAIHDANANGQKNTIRLAAGTYPLTAVDNNTDGPNGLPVITSPLTIQGARAATTIIEPDSSAPPFRLLRVAATGTLTLNRLTLRGGQLVGLAGDGGGIYNSGTMTLIDCILAGNTRSPGGAGGGIANAGTMTLIDCIVADNFTVGGGGNGGGIYNSGTMTLIDCTLAGNFTVAFAGDGGGIYNSGTMTLINCTLADNTVTDTSGGGIFNVGTMTLTNCTLVDNESRIGGGGGGIANGGTMTLTNCTVARNMATGINIRGGGIANSGTLTLTNCTVVDNATSGPGGGIVNGGGGSTTLQNTILARNSTDCSGVVTSLGTNLIGNASGCTITPQSGDLVGIDDPGLGEFTDNGKPGTGHVPLLPGSPAIDAGNDAACPRRDQLGQRRVNIPRVGTSRCDIGAIEFPGKDHRPHEEKEDHHDKDLAAATRATP